MVITINIACIAIYGLEKKLFEKKTLQVEKFRFKLRFHKKKKLLWILTKISFEYLKTLTEEIFKLGMGEDGLKEVHIFHTGSYCLNSTYWPDEIPFKIKIENDSKLKRTYISINFNWIIVIDDN